MIEISLGDVPLYLRGGDYYKALSDNGDGTFSVPPGVLKADPRVGSIGEARHLLASLQFWIIDIDESIIRNLAMCFVSSTDRGEAIELIREFGVVFPFLHVVEVFLSDSKILLNGDWFGTSIVHRIALVEAGRVKRTNGWRREDMLDLHSAAVRNGNLDCLKYLVNHGYRLNAETSRIAASRGQLHILEYLQGLLDYGCCRLAAQHGHLDCLQYARENGCSWDSTVCAAAAGNGQLASLQYAHQNGCRWGTQTCAMAAQNGHIACLQYAHLNGCPWDSETCYNAMKGGQFACLLYALENGCAWNNRFWEIQYGIVVRAFQAGKDECGFYLLSHCNYLDSNVYYYAAEENRIDIMEACVSARIPWHVDTCDVAEARGHKKCMEFALARGAPTSNKTFRNVYKNLAKYYRK